MFFKEPNIPLFSLVMSVSSAADMISQKLANHQKRVAFIANELGGHLGLSTRDRQELMMAGALHDIGALSLKERLDALHFELKDGHAHAEAGYLLLNTFAPFSEIARLVRYHHTWYSTCQSSPQRVPFRCHLLHLADRMDVMIDADKHILYQVEDISIILQNGRGTRFHPDVVDAFVDLSRRESFWLDLICLEDEMLYEAASQGSPVVLDTNMLAEWSRMLSHIIDFRCRFTAVHSSGVAAVAEALALKIGLSKKQARLIQIAGYLHDFGKLAVPSEILEKKGPLTSEERAIVKSHAYYSSVLLRRVPEMDQINAWISCHHERPDGQGYPFKLSQDDLSLGAKIMAVADVFTAITEDRPYREGMAPEDALQVLISMSEEGGLNKDIVNLLILHFNYVNALRMEAQETALADYTAFETALQVARPAA